MQLSARLHHPQGDSDEEGDDKGDAHTQIEGVFDQGSLGSKGGRPNIIHSMACYRIIALYNYI